MAGLDDTVSLSQWVFKSKTGSSQMKDAHSQETFTLDSRFVFTLQFMGRVPGARRQGAELIEYIDEQKQYGHVAYATSTQDTVYMSLTRYGVKVTDVNEEEVFHRIPFHQLGSVTYYMEDSTKHILALETGNMDSDACLYYLYQADSEGDASRICDIFGKAFQLVHMHLRTPPL